MKGYLQGRLNDFDWFYSLWGNSTDLSLLIDMSEEDIKALQSTGTFAPIP